MNKNILLVIFLLFVFSFPIFSDENQTKDYHSTLFSSATLLAAFQKDNSGSYIFQGPPPGLYFLYNGYDIFFHNDYLKFDPSIYYAGVGFITDSSIQYGYVLDVLKIQIIPASGFGIITGILNNGGFYNLYIPLSILSTIFTNETFELQILGQMQFYFLTERGLTYWPGGKIASNFIFKFKKADFELQPVFGGGGSQILTGIRIGCQFHFN